MQKKYHWVLCTILFLACSNGANHDGELVIPFSIENNRIILDAVINRQAGRFVLDTSALVSSVGISAFGLVPIGSVYHWVNEEVRESIRFGIRNIRFGDVNVRARSWIATRGDRLSSLREAEGFDGFLGIRTFEGYWMELSFSRNEIVLHRQKPGHFTNHVPLKMRSRFHRLYLPITVNDQVFYMELNTSVHGLHFPHDLDGFANPDNKWQVSSNWGDFHLVRTDSINILDRTYNDKLVLTNGFVAARAKANNYSFVNMGIIGIGFMQHYDFLFDFTGLDVGRTAGMYFKSINDAQERDYGFVSFFPEAPWFGIVDFVLSDDGMEIRSILTDSAAYMVYGLRHGTIITDVNGQSIGFFSEEELRNPSFFQRNISLSIINDQGEVEIIEIQNADAENSF